MLIGQLDFSSKEISVARKHEDILPASKLVPSVLSGRATKENVFQDPSCIMVPEPTANKKITIDQNQLMLLLEMTKSYTKAEQMKEQREKKEAEMR